MILGCEPNICRAAVEAELIDVSAWPACTRKQLMPVLVPGTPN